MDNHKKGAAHLEMIMSFVLFFVFVIFLLAYVRPYGTTVISNSAVVALHDTFFEKAHTNLTKFFLKANYTGEQNCFHISLDPSIFTYGFENTGSLVFDSEGKKMNSFLYRGDLNLQSKVTYYDVLLSPDFYNSQTSLSCIDEYVNYSLGSFYERQILSQKKLLQMESNYQSNYDLLRDELEIPKALDFSISSELVEMKRLVPQGINVVAQDFVEEVLMQDGSIKMVRFTIAVW